MRIYQVDPRLIRILDSPGMRDITYQANRLETEGQIEPMVVRPVERPPFCYEINTEHDEHFHLDEAIAQAACWLGWPTVLVTY